MSSSPQTSKVPAQGRPVLWLIASLTACAVVAGVSLAGLHALGLTRTEPPAAAAAPEKAAVTVLSLEDSPAANVLNQVLAAAPAEWNRSGSQQASVAAPFPFNCATPGTAPALSQGQDFTVDGQPVQVVLTAHTAGLAAEAMTLQNAGIRGCKLDTDSVSQAVTAGLGSEAYTATARRGGATATITTVRRGDVISYVTSSSRAAADTTARTLDGLLAGQLASVCVAEQSSAVDATRSLWAQATYQPFQADKTVDVKDPGLPKVPADATFEARDLSAPAPAPVAAVTPATKPEYPVWPAMPAAVPRPGTLTVPAADSPHTTSIKIPAEDVDGPGCGWAFTGMAGPAFDEAAAKATTKKSVEDTKVSLTSGVKTWSKSVLDYWAAYDKQAADVAAYDSYAATVTQVNAAWDAISRQWATYRANLAAWQKQVDTRAKFVTDQAAAQASFDDAVAACETVTGAGSEPGSTSAPTPSPSGTATPQPTSAPKPKALSETDKKRAIAECVVSVERPAILDQAPPFVGPEPVKPADPRPEGQRG